MCFSSTLLPFGCGRGERPARQLVVILLCGSGGRRRFYQDSIHSITAVRAANWFLKWCWKYISVLICEKKFRQQHCQLPYCMANGLTWLLGQGRAEIISPAHRLVR